MEKMGIFAILMKSIFKNREKWIDATVKKLPVKAVGENIEIK